MLGVVKTIREGIPYISNGQVEVVRSLSLYDLDGKIDSAIELLTKLKEEGWQMLDYDSFGGYDGPEYNLSTWRDATPEEIKLWDDYQAECKAHQEERDKLHYEALKKKFE